MKFCNPKVTQYYLLFFLFSLFTNAQENDSLLHADTRTFFSGMNKKPESTETFVHELINRITLKGILQTQYVNSFTSGVDYSGKHFGNEKHKNSIFNVKRAKIQTHTKVTDKAEAVLSATFSSSASNTTPLRNAYISYSFSPLLNIRMGQFRPQTGVESTYSVDIVRSLAFSNQYYNLKHNGWTGSQVGADISGKIERDNLSVSYVLGAFNSNEKNVPDNEKGKKLFIRNTYYFPSLYNFNIGFTGGIDKISGKDIYLTLLDANTTIPLTSQWSFFMESQMGRGTNSYAYFNDSENEHSILSDYIMQGWYILPNLRYEPDTPLLHSLEFSCRYEQWEDRKSDSNMRTSIIPSLSFEFVKNYNLRLTLALEINRYSQNIAGTSLYNSDIFTTQLQARF